MVDVRRVLKLAFGSVGKYFATTRTLLQHGPPALSRETTMIVRPVVLRTALVALATGCTNDTVETNAAGDVILRDFSCKSCIIVADSIAFLGHPDDTLSLRMGNVPAMDSRGNLYLGDSRGASVLVFRPDGRLATTFGRGGEGPGELARVSRVLVGRGDTLYLQGAPWIYVFSPQHGYLRQFQNPRPVGGAGGMFAFIGTILSDDRLLLSSGPNGFVILDRAGVPSPQIELAGLDSAAPPCGDCVPRGFRESIRPGSVWSAPHNSYRVEQHDLSGRLLQRFIRVVDWYPDWNAAQLRGSEDPISAFGKPRVWGVRQGADGIVWTHVLQIEDADSFRKTWTMSSPRAPEQLISRLSTAIEAIDPSRQLLLAGIRLGGPVLPMTGDYAAQIVFDDEGGFGWKIIRFRVERH
jgi:hypothetical protein